MPKIVGAFFRRKFVEEFAYFGPQSLDSSLRCFAQERFEFCKDLFDRIEVGRVRRQISQSGARRFDRLAHAWNLVRRQVVHDDDIIDAQCRRQHLLDIGDERCSIHRAIKNEGRGQRIDPEAGDESGRFPMAVRNFPKTSLPAWRATIAPRHVRACPGFIEEYEACCIEVRLLGLPFASRLGDVRTVLLGRVHGFF